MICKNCGAEFSDQLSICPYCGTENYRAALSEHREELERIHGRTEDLKYMKERIARKATRITGYVVAGVVIYFLLMVGVTYGVARYKAAHSLEIQNAEIAVLEECYEAGEYEKLYDLIVESDFSYRATYEKYYRVAFAYENYESNVSYMDSVYDYIMQVGEDKFLCDALCYTFRNMKELKVYEAEGFLYGESEGIKRIEKMYMEYLSEKFLLSQTEIEKTLESMSEEPDEEEFRSLARKITATVLKEKAK